MRALLLVLLVLLGLAVGYFVMGQGGAAPGPAPGAPAPGDGGMRQGVAPAALPEGVVATRTEAGPPAPTDVAELPTACLKIVDLGSAAPLPGAFVRAVMDGADLAFADEQGLAPVPLKKAAQLAVVLDGYLLRLVPTQLGSTEKEPQYVRLVRDEWSITMPFEFFGPDGASVDDVFVRFRPRGDAQALTTGPRGDAVRERAWTEHTMLASRPVCHDVAVQMGLYNADRVHRLRGAMPTVRFLAGGTYDVEAATTTGLVGRTEVRVAAGPEPPPVRVALAAGTFVRGRVLDLAGTAVAGAELTVQGGDPLGLLATSAADGAFALGPLAPGQQTLLVRSRAHEPLEHSTSAPADGQELRMRALPTSPLRGRVRSRPDLTPIAGATVVWQIAQGQATTARTGDDGTFELQAAGQIAGRLLVRAEGHVPYSELVDPGASMQDYDLLPADTTTRLAKRLTATLEGVVFDSNGWPAAGAQLRWRPAGDVSADVVSTVGRRVLEGGTLQLPLATTTNEVGAFVLETHRFGPGRLTLADDEAVGVTATATAGSSTTGLEIRR